jgi:GH18 family chitinase
LAVLEFQGLIVCSSERTVCYYSSWAVYRNGEGKFDTSRVDPFLCTHLIYAFVGTNPDGSVKLLDAWNDINLSESSQFIFLISK